MGIGKRIVRQQAKFSFDRHCTIKRKPKVKSIYKALGIIIS